MIRNWPALLGRLATTRALDRLRQRLREQGRCETVPEWSAVKSPDAGPDQALQAAELSQQLRRALTQLPADQSEAFCLRFLEDLSYRQIAQQMRIKTNAVGVLLHRARAQLREQLSSVHAGNEL